MPFVRAGQRAYEIGMIGYLVEVLLQRGADADVAEAEEAVERLAKDELGIGGA